MMKLRIEKGFEAGRVFDVESELVTIGRAPDNDIVLSDTMVSQHHAKIWRDLDGKISVTDMDSVNGTEVNGRAVQTAELRAGDRVLVGKTVIRIVEDGTPVEAQPVGRAREERRSEPRRSEETRRKKAAVAEEQEELVVVGPATGAGEATIDLGFEERKRPKSSAPAEKGEDAGAKSSTSFVTNRVKMVIIGAIGIVLLAVVAKFVSDKLGGQPINVPKRVNAATLPTEIYYETIIGSVGSPKNPPQLRRLEVTLKDGKLAVALDAPSLSLQGQRLRKEKQLTQEDLKQLIDSLRLANLAKIDRREKITQLVPQTYAYTELRVTQGTDYMEFVIRNTDLPDEMRTTVDALMSQVLYHLNVRPDQPEVRIANATAIFEEATRFLNSPTAHPANLYRAWKRFKGIELELEDLEPKPTVYLEAQKNALTVREQLEQAAGKNMAGARVHIQLREWELADRLLQSSMEMVERDTTDEIYKRAFEEWQRKVLPNLPRK
jgi:pSer/pThr/pTyr-binding forkhead associated (FHA) protein